MEGIFDSIILQPTSLCNLNCSYCYLAHRDENLKMAPKVIERIVEALEVCGYPFRVTWHGGEPLSSGLEHFRSLMEPMESLTRNGQIQHIIQTNGTLIDARWCEFFLSHSFMVGVSIDGPEWANEHRENWRGKSSYNKVLSGVNLLKQNGVEFSSICVVTKSTISRPEELYDFFCDLGCFSLGINMEEKLGVNNTSVEAGELVMDFWQRLFRAWKKNPKIEIQPFRKILSRLEDLSMGKATSIQRFIDKKDLFPSVSYAGDVVLLSPEFLDAKSDHYNNFVVGNVLDEPLLDILRRWRNIQYVTDFYAGVRRCEEVCQYFAVCGGGQASNKFFELGTTDATETNFCRNAHQHLTDILMSEL